MTSSRSLFVARRPSSDLGSLVTRVMRFFKVNPSRLLLKIGFVEGYFLGVSSGKSEIMRYSNHLFASSIAFKRALFGANKVSVISGSSVTIAKV